MNKIKLSRRGVLLAIVAILSGVAATAYLMAGSDTRAASVPPAEGPAPLSTYQEGILADGVVTATEYAGALNKAADCVEAAGFHAVRPGDPQLNGQLAFVVNIGEPKDMSAARLTVRKCETEFVSALGQPWTIQQQGGAQAPAVWKAAVATCLRAAGADVTDLLTPEEVNRIVEQHTFVSALATCEQGPPAR